MQCILPSCGHQAGEWWNLCMVGTIWTQLAVLYREVFLIQRPDWYIVLCGCIGTADSVLIRKVAIF